MGAHARLVVSDGGARADKAMTWKRSGADEGCGLGIHADVVWGFCVLWFVEDVARGVRVAWVHFYVCVRGKGRVLLVWDVFWEKLTLRRPDQDPCHDGNFLPGSKSLPRAWASFLSHTHTCNHSYRDARNMTTQHTAKSTQQRTDTICSRRLAFRPALAMVGKGEGAPRLDSAALAWHELADSSESVARSKTRLRPPTARAAESLRDMRESAHLWFALRKHVEPCKAEDILARLAENSKWRVEKDHVDQALRKRYLQLVDKVKEFEPAFQDLEMQRRQQGRGQ